jgi:two-component system, sensor histidine kinase RpfC
LNRLLTRVRILRRRLKARPDSEHEQAIIRIVIVALVLAYMGATYPPSEAAAGPGQGELLLLQGLAAALVLALALFVSICIWPASNVPRRVVGMVSDAGAATFCMFLAGESGVSMVGVYLFITFGNGFRYGRAYLFACQTLCLIGYCGVLLFAPYWQAYRVAGWSLLVALVILPLYVSTLLKRVQESRARAEEANRAKSSFLANMSHEMRTPLSGIVGVADLLQTTTLSPQQAELMRLMRHSVILLRSLVDDVLDISKIEAGRLTIEMADFDLHATLNGLVGLLRPYANAKGLGFHAMVDPAIDYRLCGDPHHLRQILLNLLSNAIKFTERGEIAIEVTLLAETEEGLRLRFDVRDTGIGISEIVQRRIFERFVQADDSTTRRYGGTGLGTTIAKQLVELMGGVIGVKSALGAGSTFWFEIPLLKPIADSMAEATIDDQHVAFPTVGLLVTDASPTAQVRTLVEAACGRFDAVSVALVAPRVRKLQEQGVTISAVLACGNVESASQVFAAIAAERATSTFAMVYLAPTPPSSSEEAKLRKIEGVTCVSPNVSPRVLRNAIHAAMTHDVSEGAEIIDLGQVLKEQRQPLRILVAEDNATNQAIVRKLLESAGHTVLLASDGEEALDLYEQERPELAVLDFNMPERNGLEVCTAIRTMEPTGTRLPVIILSASVTIEARDRARQAGADEFVGKPFEAANLLQVIDRLARRAGRGYQVRPKANTAIVASVALLDQSRVQAVRNIASDSTFLTQLVSGFRGDMETLLDRLDSEVANEQRAAISDAVHAIRGAALGIGAQQLAARCTSIDDAAANGHFGQLRILSAEMRRCFAATSAQLTDYSVKKGALL